MAKSSRNMMCWLLFSSGLLLLAPQAVAAECIKSVRWNDDAPYSFRGPDGEISGFNADLAREALRRLGCSATFVEMPWARALVELEAGRLDVLPGTLLKPEREVFAYFSGPVNHSPNVLFVHKSKLAKYPARKLEDLIGTDFRLGIQIGVSYGSEFDALIQTPTFAALTTALSSRKSLWKMIEVGRLDGIIADEVTALTELQQLGLKEEIVRSRVVIAAGSDRFALSKTSTAPAFFASFKAALEAMLKDGKYKEIREKHIPCTASAKSLGCE